MKTRKRQWLKVTFAEALPLFPNAPDGPRYAPGSEWWYFPEDRVHVEFMAEYQRAKGFTVTVSAEIR